MKAGKETSTELLKQMCKKYNKNRVVQVSSTICGSGAISLNYCKSRRETLISSHGRVRHK